MIHRSTAFAALLLLPALFALGPARGEAAPVRLTEVTWGGVGCYKIEMPMGTVYFEKDNGVSGFKSFLRFGLTGGGSVLNGR